VRHGVEVWCVRKVFARSIKKSTQYGDIMRNGSVGDREKLICVSSRSGRSGAVAGDLDVVEEVRIEA
jgi:hypothetical protein